jgi:integrase/recombinase XerD
MTELRRRMLEELRLRNHSHAERAYIRCLANFAKHFRTAPDRLGPEHIRNYQLFLVQQKKFSWGPFNQTVCALRFFYHDVLHQKWMIEHIPYPRYEQKLPVILSPTEIAALLQNTPTSKTAPS